MKTNESGRSMIEMLGVLAIIGVLSVGGIAGYAKAMAKFRVNKTVDQVTQIVASTRNLFAGQKNYLSLGVDGSCSTSAINSKLIKKGHLVPDEMLKGSGNNATTTLNNPYGGDVILSCGVKRDSDTKAFVIIYKDIPQEACIELATQDWGSGGSSGLVGICVNAEISGIKVGDSSTDKCAVTKPLSVLQASSACSSNLNTISWKFY